MGAQWKHTGRIENSSKRGALISKLVKEIIVATKTGGANAEGNARLRAAIESAKKASVPRDNIERAIKKGSGQLDDGVQIENVTYEGFAPHRVPVIVECLTENRNRTASDIRLIFRAAQLGNTGSVAWMFDRVGLVEGTHTESRDLESDAIEAGAQDFEEGSPGGRFFTDPADLDKVTRALQALGWNITQSELSYQAKNKVALSEDQKTEVIAFLNEVDDQDDVHRIYVGM